VVNTPPLSESERHALSAAAALIAISVRNVQLVDETRENSLRDGLTGCFNQAYGLETLQSEMKRARRTGRPLSVVMFDIDHFKTVNDTAGHLHGDAVLAAVGRQLTEVLRSTDVRCRYGGDEFLIILPDTPVLGAQHVAECIRRGIAEMTLPNGRPAEVTASLGVTAALAGETDVKSAIARADEALYRAKRAGRNRFILGVAPGAPAASADNVLRLPGSATA
jgi:diguanylate cyclase (GGDEF)-like protein